VSSLLEQIAARRAELADAAQHLTKQLTDVQHELERVSVAEQVVTQMLAETEPADQDIPLPAPSTSTGASTSSGFLIIPYRQQASGLSELPADYQLLLQTVTAAGGPLICKDICRAAGLGTESGQVEGTRAKLNRLAERGWLRKTAAGSFTSTS
jgi:chaperonin cofactor prefoldin